MVWAVEEKRQRAEAAESIAGRSYFHVYDAARRGDLHRLIGEGFEKSGSRVIWASSPTKTPFFFGIQSDRGERLGVLIYPFRLTKVPTPGRPVGEHHAQLKLGPESEWRDREHRVGFDIAGVDTTLLLGINAEDELFVGLDPRMWDPLPLGISFYAYDEDFAQMGDAGWYAWEVDNRAGPRNGMRSQDGLESRVAFAPDRLLDFARFERRSADLGLDTSLRLNMADRFVSRTFAEQVVEGSHALESQFALNAQEILDIIDGRSRLAVAVRGGVAEHHLETGLRSSRRVRSVERRDRDGEPDFDVVLADGRSFVIECKNVSPTRYADGGIKVEVQKTRASKNDPASRFYRVTEFDVVAACLFSATGAWEFKFALSSTLQRHSEFVDRLAPIQRVDNSWVDELGQLNRAP